MCTGENEDDEGDVESDDFFFLLLLLLLPNGEEEEDGRESRAIRSPPKLWSLIKRIGF